MTWGNKLGGFSGTGVAGNLDPVVGDSSRFDDRFHEYVRYVSTLASPPILFYAGRCYIYANQGLTGK